MRAHVRSQPANDFLKGCDIRLVQAKRTSAALLEQTGFAENAQVIRQRGVGYFGKRLMQFRNRAFS